jgi:hypothetical protein
MLSCIEGRTVKECMHGVGWPKAMPWVGGGGWLGRPWCWGGPHAKRKVGLLMDRAERKRGIGAVLIFLSYEYFLFF